MGGARRPGARPRRRPHRARRRRRGRARGRGVDRRRGARRARGARAARARVRAPTSCSTRWSARPASGPTVATLGEGIDLALANKESLVVGGELVTQLAEATGAQIIPVDSEHSALHQLHRRRAAGHDRPARRHRERGPVPRAHARRARGRHRRGGAPHPTWAMGGKITIDSATLMNKGLEVIEAHHLFGTPYERIDVVVHPQSIVHALRRPGRRRGARAPRPSRHARADLLRAALPRARRRPGRAAARPGRGRRADLRARRHSTPSRACASRARPRAPAAPRRACSTPPTRSPSTRSSTAGSTSSASPAVDRGDARAPAAPRPCARSSRSTRPTARRARSRRELVAVAA